MEIAKDYVILGELQRILIHYLEQCFNCEIVSLANLEKIKLY